VHPSEHEDLYNKIVDGGGLVISEYALGYHPRKWTYVKRNRIVAGLSKAVVVVEAAENSGSIITAGFADEYKRKVFAVPSSILDVRSKGTNGLIKDYGVLIDSGYQINDYVGSKKSKHSSKYSSVVDELLNLINRSPASLDEISEQINSDTMILSNLITSMTIEGMIENRKGLYYAC
jgi:DNA processing protein